MKKAKVLIATLSAATLAVACGAFVACGGDEPPTPPPAGNYEITFDANGGSYAENAESVKLTTDENGRLAAAPAADPTYSGYSFANYNTAADGSGTEITYGVSGYQFTAATTVYAQWVEAGLYTADGKFVAELESSTPGDTAELQYGASGVELAPGDVLQIKIKGTTITHNAGTLELWMGSDCHGVNFDQTAATFTVKEGNERAFDVYAKYYANGTPCWSIYMTDGLTDALYDGGAYLVGGGWENGSWDITADNYVHPEDGLTVHFTSDASFKITDYIETPESGSEHRGWKYNSPSYYKMAEGKEEGYLNLGSIGASGNGSVLAPGEYTITIEGEGENIKFVFTPAADLAPAELPDKYVQDGFYLAGSGFDGAAWDVKEGFYIDPENGLTVTFTKNAQFQVVSCKSATTGGANWNYGAASYYQMSEGAEDGYIVLPSGGNGTVKTAGTYTITINNSGETPVFVITPEAGLEPDQTVEILHYYIQGSMHDSWNTPITDEYELKPVEGNDGVYQLTIDLDAGVEFGFRSFAEDASGEVNSLQIDWFGGNLTLAEGVTEITKGNNLTTVSAGTYTFTLDPANKTLGVTFVGVSAPDPEPEQPGPGTETENPAE